ncbi:amidase family protein [Phenylobacterium aquaticum]|uniref:amidase family protein n=2 Tax=Phenylobacterium aquaticum TaxID=1763816 RepID=UPI0026EB6A77|nr:amidase family protein [Phenylobacterium aquaticum]
MSATPSEDLAYETATDLVAALAARAVSSVELTKAAIARIEGLDGPVNAVVVRDFDRALGAAKAADAALARGEHGALLGLPMTVKESQNVAGLRTSWGTEVFGTWIAPQDSVGVARLKAAGAVVLGKTNVPPFLGDWQSANPIYGRTSNPWDLGRSPGGSSGGAAAALAAGMVPLEFGSDIGGSIRIPAALCGVYGHKPSFDLIPQRGHAPPGTDGGGVDLAVVGPLARSARDLELALGVLAGPEGLDAKGYRLDLAAPRHAALADYNVLVLDHHPLAELDGEVRDALHRLARDLDDQGCEVTHESDLLPNLAEAHELYVRMLTTITSRGGPPQPNPLSAEDWMGLMDGQLLFRRRMETLFERFDVVLAPAFGTPAFPHITEPNPGARVLEVNGRSTSYFAQLAWAGPATLGCLPATAAPIGQSQAGLPIGVQILGGFLEDRTTLAFAGLLERTFGGFRRPPGY